jgi:hypothetical protein
VNLRGRKWWETGEDHNEELHNLYILLNIVRVIKSRRMTSVGHVAWMGEMRNAYNILVGKPDGKRPLGRLGVAGKTILEWILGKFDGRGWTELIWLSVGTSGGPLSTRQ